jgi:hypothetical protein
MTNRAEQNWPDGVAIEIEMNDSEPEALIAFEAQYGRLTPAYRRNLLKVLARDTVAARNSGLTLLCLRAFPSSPTQKMLRSLMQAA